MVTAFDEEGRVDIKQTRKLASSLLSSGSDGVVVAGTTGESPTLDKEEKLKLFYEIKDEVRERGAVIAGIGSYSTRDSVNLAREAQKTGVDGLMAVVPYYNKPTQKGLLEHFRQIASSANLPLLIYNVPSRTSLNISAEVTIELSKAENIVGIKEASSNLGQIAHIIGETDDDFMVYSGNDQDTLPVLAVGGYGLISVASHLVGKRLKRMMHEFTAGRVESASQIHRELLPLFDVLFSASNPIPVKYALSQVGFSVGKPRLPLTEADEEVRASIRTVLTGFDIDLKPY
jgi:4-hydroxy-tetrahydrodipicolinate synthase